MKHFRDWVAVITFVLLAIMSGCGGGDPKPSKADGKPTTPKPWKGDVDLRPVGPKPTDAK